VSRILLTSLQIIFYLILFTLSFLVFWPEPLFFDLTTWTRDLQLNMYNDFYLFANYLVVLVLLIVAFIILEVIYQFFGFFVTIKKYEFSIWAWEVLPKKPLNRKNLTSILIIFLGLISGFLFNVSMGGTIYTNGKNKYSATYVNTQNYRRELAKIIGSDSFFGIDLTFPSNRTKYDIREIGNKEEQLIADIREFKRNLAYNQYMQQQNEESSHDMEELKHYNQITDKRSKELTEKLNAAEKELQILKNK